MVGEIEFLSDVEELVVSPFVVAELEPMVREKFGQEGWLAVLAELAGGAWAIAVIDGAHLRAMREFVGEGDSGACVTSAAASIAVLAALTDS